MCTRARSCAVARARGGHRSRSAGCSSSSRRAATFGSRTQAVRRLVLVVRRPRLSLPRRRVRRGRHARGARDAHPQPLPAQPLRGAARGAGQHVGRLVQALARVPLLCGAEQPARRARAHDGGGLPPRRGLVPRAVRPRGRDALQLRRAQRPAAAAGGARPAERRRAAAAARRRDDRPAHAGADHAAADHQGLPLALRAGEAAGAAARGRRKRERAGGGGGGDGPPIRREVATPSRRSTARRAPTRSSAGSSSSRRWCCPSTSWRSIPPGRRPRARPRPRGSRARRGLGSRGSRPTRSDRSGQPDAAAVRFVQQCALASAADPR